MVKGPDKLLNLRRDSLGLVLCASNAQPSSRVLVVEGTLGLLAGAATQRVGGDGRVLSASIRCEPPSRARTRTLSADGGTRARAWAR